MELPKPMEDIHRLHQMAEAQKIGRPHEETASGEARATSFLTLVAVGAVLTVIGLMFSNDGPPRELFWRIPLAAAILWIPVALCVWLFSSATIPWKRALWMGAWPSIAALLPLVVVFLIALPVVLVIVVYHWIRSLF